MGEIYRFWSEKRYERYVQPKTPWETKSEMERQSRGGLIDHGCQRMETKKPRPHYMETDCKGGHNPPCKAKKKLIPYGNVFVS